jgi:hypothetical protein
MPTMWLFQVCQCLKDGVAAFIFLLFANMPLLLNDLEMLCLFCSIGCLIDSIFISIRLYKGYIITLATIKDTLGVVGLFCLTILLSYKWDLLFWQPFFYAAFLIDYISILTICSRFNIYRGAAFKPSRTPLSQW